MRKRAKHTLSHYRMHTAKMGELFPIACVPVLPGDTVQHSSSALVRAAPLNTPVMHPVNVRIHHFFVPNRIIWDGWEDFITGGPDGMDESEIPQVVVPQEKKSLLTYLGVPYITGEDDIFVNALPLFAANKIFNEFYRDQDLVPERDLTDQTLPRCAWEKDYFTTSRPWTQKGPDVVIPVSGRASVYGGSGETPGTHNPPQWEDLDGNPLGPTRSDIGTGGDEFGLYTGANNPPADEEVRFRNAVPIGAWADVSGLGASVNSFREAFALQRYQEARARYGSRFTEYLRYLGITPSDARLQRPEYLGGGSARLQFSEVLQTTPADTPDTAGVGDLYGHGIAGVRSNRYRKFFEEHGYVITFMSVRPKSTYLNGIPREFLKTTKEDYFQKELVHLGQQPVYSAELNGNIGEGGVFGYQDRYDEYRQHPSQVHQDFRDLLASWHLARNLDTSVTLNQDFIECDPDDRIFQVQEGDNLWCMINHRIVARRMVPRRAYPKIL